MVRVRLSSRLLLAGAAGLGTLLSASVALKAAEPPAPPSAAPAATPEGIEFFEKRIRPLLAEQCFACHNSKASSPMGGLALDTAAAFKKGGDHGALVQGADPVKSLLLKAVRWEDRELQMPPKGKLPPEKIADLEAWVKMGAPWPAAAPAKGGAPKPGVSEFKLRAKHWSFQPVKPVKPPAPKNAAWARTPVDRFILAKLEAKGLKPAPGADRRTLIRRVTYDLTGLPPTPEEVQAFLQDKSPNAYEKVVDRLLASSHYGERWGRHWLDLMRFAETDGHEFDFEKPGAFMYRDYVTRAFNADVPYQQFVMEHLAGDLLPKPRVNPQDGSNESIIGTGFWFLGEGKHSPVDLLEDEAERVDNQIDVVSKSFLGLSMGCARCHDHKFDPVTAKDYYALSGFLKSSRYQFAAIDAPEPLRKAAKELEGVNSQLGPQLAARTVEAQRSRLDRMAEYLLAARDVLLAPAPAAAAGDVVFEDFEKDSYGAWKTTGKAFGDRPNAAPIPSHQGELNFLGKGLVNTHSARIGDAREVGDQLTGTLTSPAFTIEKPYIRFLIGGGKHEGKTCVNLLVDGKVVRKAHGRNENRMDWTHWDVRDLKGKQAQIQAVDEVTGGWGNIGLDHIVFSDQADPLAGTVARVASERKLDGEDLARWVRHLRESAGKTTDPFHPFAKLIRSGDFKQAAAGMLADLRPEMEACASPAGTLFEDFSGKGYDGWFVTGEAFGEAPTQAPVLRMQVAGTARPERVVDAGVADSGRISDRLQGALRSKTFTLEKPRILFRMAGKDAQINLIIDSFQRIRYPIYGGLRIDVNNSRPAWYAMDVAKWAGHRAYIEILDHGRGYVAVDQILFADGPAPAEGANPAVVKVLEGAASPEDLARRYQELFKSTAEAWAGGRMSGEAQAEIVNWLLSTDPSPAACDGPMLEMANRRGQLENTVPDLRRVMAITDGTPETQRVYIRGSSKSLGDDVPRRFLELFGSTPAGTEGSGRLVLARKLVESPLFARVWVNRVWMHHFGEGLVRTPDDFGLRGEKPTHPELLEWLTAELPRMGWSTKKLHRMLLLSSTYRQASRGDAKAEAADPANLLLHRMPVRRLEAEAIRDGILAVSGRLDRTLYGPSVLPYLTPFMEGRGRPEKSGPLDGSGRRSLYISVRRNFLTPMFLAFDYPIPFNTIGRRSISTVPSQALVLMNNPFVVEQAGFWAKRMLEDKKLSARERIVRMYETAFSRPPTEAELTQSLAFVEEQARQPNADESRTWADLAHVLYNTKEFIFIN